MTDPKAQADAIDPRLSHGKGRDDFEWQAAFADLIAASDTIRALLSRIEELESERDDWKLQFDLLKEECEQLSIHAALAGKMAIEQCRAVIRYRASVGAPTSETFEALDAKLDSLSKPIDRNALIERGARAMCVSRGIDPDDPWPQEIRTSRDQVMWMMMTDDARAILSAWIGEETK